MNTPADTVVGMLVLGLVCAIMLGVIKALIWGEFR